MADDKINPQDFAMRHIRDTLRQRYRATSRRALAREVGMSPRGLANFLDGAVPFSPTVRKLRKWYVNYAAAPVGEVSEADARAALALLFNDLSPLAAAAVGTALMDRLLEGYHASGRQAPAWVLEMRREFFARLSTRDGRGEGVKG